MKNLTREALEAGINVVDQIVELTGQNRFDIIAAMKRLEKRGMGKFVVGRKGHLSRFEAFTETPAAPKPVLVQAPSPPTRAEVEKAVNLLRQYILEMDTNILHPKRKSGTYIKTGT
jgi:hypothetical protein